MLAKNREPKWKAPISMPPRRLRGASRPAERGNFGIQAAHPAWRSHAWRMLALWALVLAAYSNSFQSGLVFDNAMVISRDARIQAVTPQNLRLILTQQYWQGSTASGLYRPLTTFSYLLNYAVFGNGTNPAGYHWVNLALHASECFARVPAGHTGIGISRAGLGAGSALGSASAAHRIRHQYCGPRRPAGRLRCAGRLALLREERLPLLGRRKLLWVAAMLVAQAVGIFSKENAAVLPGHHVPVRPDMAKARGVAGARAGLRRLAAAVGRVLLVARHIANCIFWLASPKIP